MPLYLLKKDLSHLSACKKTAYIFCEAWLLNSILNTYEDIDNLSPYGVSYKKKNCRI